MAWRDEFINFVGDFNNSLVLMSMVALLHLIQFLFVI